MKLRERVSQLTAGSSHHVNVNEVYEVMANYFESKTSLQSMRYDFFYGVNSRQMPSESPATWAKRLSDKAEHCDFEQMTQEEALALVMCRYGKMEAASRKRKNALKNVSPPPMMPSKRQTPDLQGTVYSTIFKSLFKEKELQQISFCFPKIVFSKGENF